MTHLTDELRELEAEIAADMTNAQEQAATPDDLCDLDALLVESIALREERVAGKALREQLAKTQDSKEREEIELLLRVWEAKYEWNTLGECAVFRQHVCHCGHTSAPVLVGVYFHQRNLSDPHTQRWVNSSEAVARVVEEVHKKAGLLDLPRKSFLETASVHICPECMEAEGYPVEMTAGLPWGFAK